MDARFNHPLIPMDRIEELIQVEPAVVIVSLVLIAWAFYKVFLRGVSEDRHRSLHRHFVRLAVHLLFFGAFLGSYYLLQSLPDQTVLVRRVVPYFGFLAICWGGLIFVKASRALLLEYLFFSHMRVGVPIVLVNSFTLILYVLVFGWLSKEIFHVQVGTLLATSAIFSILLGLALQDTLGNLFSGIALQLDKPFDLGDWVEVTAGNTKWVGQVLEISWRATVLIGLTEETISIPNRVISQGQVSNFSIRKKPICRRHIFRVAYGVDLEKAKSCLVRAAQAVPEIYKTPAPFVLLDEGTEHWIPLKLLYFIEDYGTQFRIMDQVITLAVQNLEKAGIPLAAQRFELLGGSSATVDGQPTRGVT